MSGHRGEDAGAKAAKRRRSGSILGLGIAEDKLARLVAVIKESNGAAIDELSSRHVIRDMTERIINIAFVEDELPLTKGWELHLGVCPLLKSCVCVCAGLRRFRKYLARLAPTQALLIYIAVVARGLLRRDNSWGSLAPRSTKKGHGLLRPCEIFRASSPQS